MAGRHGPPRHRNKWAWKAQGAKKINESEPGGKFRPFPEITGVCRRCRDQIEWKRKYGKYKLLTEPSKCQKCSKRTVRQAYYNLCYGCAKEQGVCAKCCRVDQLIGRDSSEIEAEQKTLEEAIRNARERDRRTLIRSMNKDNTKGQEADIDAIQEGKVEGLLSGMSINESALMGREDEDSDGDEDNEDDENEFEDEDDAEIEDEEDEDEDENENENENEDEEDVKTVN